MQTGHDDEIIPRTAAFFFVDIVGLTRKELGGTDKQVEKIKLLINSIAQCEAFQKCPEKTILPTGDGLAIDFGDQFERSFQLAIQLHAKLRAHNAKSQERERVHVRIGLHSGSVIDLKDIGGRINVWGDGIVTARRIMDLGNEDHILMSEYMAEQIRHTSSEYKDVIHPLGTFFIKHGEKITVFSAYADKYGNRSNPFPESSELTRVKDFPNGFGTESLATVWVDRQIKEKELLDTLIRSVLNTRTIDQSYMYWEASAASRWRRLCEDRNYTLYDMSLNLIRRDIANIVKKLTQVSSMRPFDFVNLGTGGGQKDTIILEHLLRGANGEKVRYIPLDKSYSMLSDAINVVLQYLGSRSGVHCEVIAILGDILTLERYSPLIYRGRNLKFYGLLGNLLGNFAESRLLGRILNVMRDDDFLMIDADLIGGRKDRELDFGYTIGAVKELMVHPVIEHLASYPEVVSNFRNAKISTKVVSNISEVSKSKTVQVVLTDKDDNKYLHAFSTKYDFESLKNYLAKTMGLRIVWTSTYIHNKTKKARYAAFVVRKD